MNKDSGKPDWSDKRWKDMLVFQRKSMMFDDTVEKFAAWMGLCQGMTVVDIGCGLGHIGHTYWPYFGRGGEYIGIDNNQDSLKEAEEAAKEWAVEGRARFIIGDAYDLLLADNYADAVMCQALLIHLEAPDKALSEMIRVTRPGGLIVCHEPDNQNPALGRLFNSLPQLEIEEHLLMSKINLICHKGRMALGNGDNAIGPKLPHTLKMLGLRNIDVRVNDRVHYLEPPYENEFQRDALNKIKEMIMNEDRYRMLMERKRKEFIAGGGDLSEYGKYLQIENKYISLMRQQLEEGKYFACAGGALYTVKGQKPA